VRGGGDLGAFEGGSWGFAVVEREEREAVGVIEVTRLPRFGEEDEGAEHQGEAHEDLET
jgi:hypothetical protein